MTQDTHLFKASSNSSKDLRHMANAIRFLSMDAVERAKSGHPGMPMGMADVATVLFTRFLKFDPKWPQWPNRDRFVLSAGHGSMLLYSLLHLTGYADMTLEELKNFRQLHSKTAGHPEYWEAPGIETTTGPLGQGLATAVGMALAEKKLAAEYGSDLVDHHTYVIAGDGCLMEGISHEAISLAGHLNLNKLVVLFDDNAISIDGPTSLAVSDNQRKRFEASGWNTWSVDGHDFTAITQALEEARKSDRPAMIACKTVIGFGAPNKAGTAATHGSPLGAEEIAGAREKLDWPYPPFEIPEGILESWRAVGQKGAAASDAWKKRQAAMETSQKKVWARRISGKLPDDFTRAITSIKEKAVETPQTIATRVSSQKVLEDLVPVMPELLGGSADLTGSNGTKTKNHRPITVDDFGGNYLHYGVREHGMAAAMNGLALHGGFIPYGGTFLVFTDYCRPAIRLSALMGQRVAYVMTHDSIGLGEDGPTHQPVEHLAALRTIPNLLVLRPADFIETAECWEIALSHTAGPSILALSRQNLAPVRLTHVPENLCKKGGYLLSPSTGKRQITLIATGSELQTALAAQKSLQDQGISAAVVSLPSMELFGQQDKAYRRDVLGESDVPRIGIEAASGFGWSQILGDEGQFIGMDGFGASAPAPRLYEHFGITKEAVVEKAKKLISKKLLHG